MPLVYQALEVFKPLVIQYQSSASYTSGLVQRYFKWEE